VNTINNIMQILNYFLPGNSRSFSLDLVDQYEGLESSGQFRFTPPTHALLGFDQALQEFQEEGGIKGRAKR
jgi:2-aminoethylphosphonate-pyruvate transaminase